MKAIIIDDIRLAREELKELLSSYDHIQIVDEAASAEEARKAIQKHVPDLIFLDIKMPEEDGFSLLESLDETPEVIFTTAYDQYALKAFENNALDYLVKPIDPDRLASALDKYSKIDIPQKQAPLLHEKSKVFVKDGERCWFVKVGSIRYFDSHGNYAKVHFEDDMAIVGKSLNYLESRLDPEKFFRANRKQIINLDYIDEVIPWFSDSFRVRMTDGTEIDISRRKSLLFKQKLSF